MSKSVEVMIRLDSPLPRLIDLHIGARLKRLRVREDLSTAQLETKAGLGVGSINKFENGSITIPPLKLIELSVLLDIRLSYFYS